MEFKEVNIDPDLEDILPIFVKATIQDLEKIGTAFSKNDYDTVARTCHTILGTAGSYGFIQLEDLIKEVQLLIHEGKTGELEPLLKMCALYRNFMLENFKGRGA